MSARVGSRFYRAPEVIVCQKDYDYSVDIWAVGCILGELLLNFIEQDDEKDRSKKQNGYKDFSKHYLFPGDSCYPLSPCSKNKQENNQFLSDNDQLIKIFEVLGSPSQSDLSFLDQEGKQ